MSTVILLNDDNSKIRMHKITDAFSKRVIWVTFDHSTVYGLLLFGTWLANSWERVVMGMTTINQLLVFVTHSPSVTAGRSPSLLLMAICALKRQKLIPHCEGIIWHKEKPDPITTFPPNENSESVTLTVILESYIDTSYNKSSSRPKL